MKYFLKLLGFCMILFCFTNKSVGYVSPIRPESVDTMETMMANMFQQPSRASLPSMELNQIIRDILFEGMEYFEQNYPQEVVNIVKLGWESFKKSHPYRKYKDEQDQIYFTAGRIHGKRYYLQDILDYGEVRPPTLVYSLIDKKGDRYVVPLVLKDTIRARIFFEPNSFELTSMAYSSRQGIGIPLADMTEYPPIDSVKAYSIIQDALPVGEKIVSQRLFNMICTAIPYWGFLTQTGSKSTSNTSIHWIDPINKEPHYLNK